MPEKNSGKRAFSFYKKENPQEEKKYK